jgi:hypothetical protein
MPGPRPTPEANTRGQHWPGKPVAEGLVGSAGEAPLVRSYSLARRSRSALPMTETELRLMAALAIMGLSNRPATG